MLFYSDKLFPSFGFGARIPPSYQVNQKKDFQFIQLKSLDPTQLFKSRLNVLSCKIAKTCG